MKKKLLATAIAATLAAPAASFAAGPVLYGQGHVSVEYLDNDRSDETNFSSNSSRIGVKGGFDLTGGLEAIYQMEWEVDITDADGEEGTGSNKGRDLNARNRFVGFKHADYGTLVLGKHDTPVKVIGRKVDLFWSSQLGQNRSLTAVRDASGAGASFDLRGDNVLAYISPDFGPVHLFAAYIADHNIRAEGIATGKTDISDDNDFDAYSAALIYDQKSVFTGDDGLFLAAGYERHNVEFDDTIDTGANGLEDNESAIRATGKYSIADFTFTLFGQWGQDQGFVEDADRNIFGGGLAYKVGRNTFKGQVYYADEIDDYTFGAGNRVDGNDSDAWLYALGIDHEFSKNVQIYAQGVALKAEENAIRPAFGGGVNQSFPTTFALGGNEHGSLASATPDETTWGVSIGTRIKF